MARGGASPACMGIFDVRMGKCRDMIADLGLCSCVRCRLSGAGGWASWALVRGGGARRPACVTRVWAYLWHDLWAYVELIADLVIMLVILGCASLCALWSCAGWGRVGRVGACGGGPSPPCGEFSNVLGFGGVRLA